MASAAEPYRRMAAARIEQQRHAEALALLQQAVGVDPADFAAWNDLGHLLLVVGRIMAGLDGLRRAVALRPEAWTTRINLAITEANVTGDVASAIHELEERLAVAPDDLRAGRNRLFLLNASDAHSPEFVFAQHRAWGERLRSIAAPAPPPRSWAHERLRLGFLSPDFRGHPVAHFVAPLWRQLDRSRFEIFAYADHPLHDHASAQLQLAATAWRPVAGWSDAQLAAQVRADEIDLLFDLAGHTADGRGAFFAGRPAPVSCSWLGYPNTTGLPEIAYRLTDPRADPPGAADALHVEQLVRLPHSAWCHAPEDDVPAVTAPPAERHGYPTFCSFNTTLKCSPRVLALWAKLLQRVPTARLLLKSRFFMDPAVAEFFRAKFAALGVAPARLMFSAWTATQVQHLASYAEADVALDTFPYHGTTTTCEALHMGLPVVTLAGATHASRVGVSLLEQIGHPEWIAASEEAYVEIAANLVRDSSRLAAIRRGLRAEMQRSSLMDAPQFARDFGAACVRMCHGANPPRAATNAT